MSSEQIPTQSPLPRIEISSLQNTAIEAAAVHKEFTETHLNTTYDIAVLDDDNIREHKIASPIEAEKCNEETKESKDQPSHEEW